MNTEEKFNYITRNLTEIVGENKLRYLLETRDIKVYWGTSPTKCPSIAYMLPMNKIGDLLKANCEVIIFFADIHASLDNLKSTFEEVNKRTIFYEFLIKEILGSMNIPFLEKLKFVKGSDIQLSKEYMIDIYKLSSITNINQAKHSGSEVVKQDKNPKLSSLLYPLLQALDEEYLGVDMEIGGIDQRKIFMYADEYLPKLGYDKRIHLMTPLIPGLTKTGKMSSSEPESKIDFYDNDTEIIRKIKNAFSVDGKIEGNCIISLLKYLVFPRLEEGGFIIDRDEKYGGSVNFETYDELEKHFIEGKICSVDIKPALAREIIKIISPIRTQVMKNIDLLKNAYPDLIIF